MVYAERMLRAMIVGALVLGAWGLSCFGGSIATMPIEQLESPEAEDRQPSHSPHREKEEREMSDDGDDLVIFDRSCDLAVPPSPVMEHSLLPKTQALVARLRRAQVFVPFPGLGGYASEGLQLTRQLSHQPDAIAAFDWLANQPRPVPQLYAYMALRALSWEHARAHIPDLSHDVRTVTVSYGCSRPMSYEVRELERDIARWDRPAPGSPEVSDEELRANDELSDELSDVIAAPAAP